MSLTLRPYQVETVVAVDAAWTQAARLIVALPTGSGKTEIAAHLIERELTGDGRALVLVERKNLCHQWRKRLLDHGFCNVGMIQATNTVAMYAPVVIGTIQSVRARGMPEGISLIVIDESHIWFQGHDKVLDGAGDVRVVGLTATPLRAGLGLRFDRVIVGATIRELINEGYLVRPRYFAATQEAIERALREVSILAREYKTNELSAAMRNKAILGDVVGTWQKRGENRQTIAFCVDKQHARDLAGEFISRHRGRRSARRDEGRRALPHLCCVRSARELRVLSSVGVLSIGFDSPVASCAILARPTLSLSLHVQQGGRILRPYPGKTDALVLDHAGNTLRHGRLEDFTPPDSLSKVDHDTDYKGRKDTAQAWVCRNCEAINPLGADLCLECDTPRRKHSNVVVLDGELQDLGADYDRAESDPGQMMTFYRMAHWYGNSKRMKNPLGWAYYATQRRFRIPEHQAHVVVRWNWRTLEPMPPDATASRWFRADLQRAIIAGRFRREHAHA